MQYALTPGNLAERGLGFVANEFYGEIPCNQRNPIHLRFCLLLSASRIDRMERFRGFLHSTSG